MACPSACGAGRGTSVNAVSRRGNRCRRPALLSVLGGNWTWIWKSKPPCGATSRSAPAGGGEDSGSPKAGWPPEAGGAVVVRNTDCDAPAKGLREAKETASSWAPRLLLNLLWPGLYDIPPQRLTSPHQFAGSRCWEGGGSRPVNGDSPRRFGQLSAPTVPRVPSAMPSRPTSSPQ
jgi:hypothetical protein